MKCWTSAFCILFATQFDFGHSATTNTTSLAPYAEVNGVRSSVHVYEGDDALLTCVIRGTSPDNTVMWKSPERGEKHGRRVLTAGDIRVTSDKRFRVIHDEGGDVWVLAIKNATATDNGLYVCEVNTDPVVRSFHQLTALSRDLQPPGLNSTIHYGNDGVAEIESRMDGDEMHHFNPQDVVISHNYTDCCRSLNVSARCLDFCVISNILMGFTNEDPENCENDFPAIVRCMADGRNHVPCCVQEGVPDICQDVCRGDYTVITDNIKTHFSCSAYTEQTLACIQQGIELIPNSPQDVQVVTLSENSLNVSWDAPSKNSATVSEYTVNVTMLKTFDNQFSKSTDVDQNNSVNIVNPHSVQVKVPSKDLNTVMKDLTPYTMYEVTVLAGNSHGFSMPSDAIRVVTLPPGKKRTEVTREKAPPLPDIKSCCIKKGITHLSCIDKLCDPSKSDEVDVTDLMICAPWTSQTYSCLTNGIDHMRCCRAHGIPSPCDELCSGNLTQIDYSYFKCLKYMGIFSNCLMRGYGVVPSAPTKVQVTNVDTDFAIISWEPPAYLRNTVLYYNLYYRQSYHQWRDIYQVRIQVNSPYVLEGLMSDASCSVYIVAVNEYGVGDSSQIVSFSLKSQALIQREEVTKEVKYNITDCCVGAAVSDICMPICSFDASMAQLKSLAGICATEFQKLIRCGAGGRDHTPCCQRRGVPNDCLPICYGVLGPPAGASMSLGSCVPYVGNIVQCYEEGTGLLPGPVWDLRAVKISNGSVSIEWSKPSDNTTVLDYVVHCRLASNSSVQQAEKMTDLILDKQSIVAGTSTKLSDLQVGKSYQIYVVSRNTHGTSLPSSILLVNATEIDVGSTGLAGVPSPPHSLTVSSRSANFVTISWQPPQYSHPAEFLSYRLYWKASGDTRFTMEETSITTYLLSNLTPNSQYIAYVAALSKAGQSLPSETLVAWTDPAFPAFVEPPTIHPANSVVEGNSMTILCIAMGTPMPTIAMYIAGRLVRQETTRHMVTVIQNVTRAMDQVSCYADNGYGTPMQASKRIKISYVPRILPSGITMTTIGDTVTLACSVESYPEPKMMFWKDPTGRIPVIDGGRYNVNVAPSNKEEDKYMMELTISMISMEDEGDYYCHAENAYGSSTQPVSVRIRNTPAAHNVTQCCSEQNVSSGCIDACSMYLDVESAMQRPECIEDLEKLMKCATDGSDHRNCCARSNVPRSCLDWCHGVPQPNNRMCVLTYAKPIMGCFREGRVKLPGPPQNVRVEIQDAHSALVKWDPPMKNPHTVDSYRVFWRLYGTKVAMKNDTKDTSLVISDLKDDVSYEVVIKSSNHMGNSLLSDPVKFSTSEKFISSAASLGNEDEEGGSVLNMILLFLFVVGLLAGGVYLANTKLSFLRKSNDGVSFENPSYLREIGLEQTNTQQQNGYTSDNGYLSNGLANGVTSNSTSGWTQEPLHVPTEKEVPPSLYDELRLGSEGAGFMRLKS